MPPNNFHGKYFHWRVSRSHIPAIILGHLLYLPPSTLLSFLPFWSHLLVMETQTLTRPLFAMGAGSRLISPWAGNLFVEPGPEAGMGPVSLPGTSDSAYLLHAPPLPAARSVCSGLLLLCRLGLHTALFSPLTFSLLHLASPLIAYLQILPMCFRSNSQEKESDHKRSLSFHGATGKMLASL